MAIAIHTLGASAISGSARPFYTSTTAATSMANVSAVATALHSEHGPKHVRGSGECELLGPFALLIQGALGLLALSSLVWKRYRERPQRPIKVWAFDASKQVVGTLLLHVANLLMSMLSAGQFSVKPKVAEDPGEDSPLNPCSFYLLNLAIDTTIGIPILIVLLRLLTQAFLLTPLAQPPESIQSGNYGHPPKTTWWAKQSIIYFLGLLGMKLFVLLLFSILPWISRVGDWALKWTEGNEALQVAFVMLLFPVIMNALQYYIIDSFIKNKNPYDSEASTEGGEGEYHEQDVDHRTSYGTSENGLSYIPEESEEALAKDLEGREVTEAHLKDSGRHAPSRSRPSNPSPANVGEYDPTTDGEDKAALANGADGAEEAPLLRLEPVSEDTLLARENNSGRAEEAAVRKGSTAEQ